MSAEDVASKIPSSDEISSKDGEDKKFVSQAVAFVIGHARNGFVALCASVASLLKEQARLKHEVEILQGEVLHLKHSIQKANVPENQQQSFKNNKKHIASITKLHALKTKNSQQLSFRKLRGCICNQCMKETTHPLTVPLNKGAKVIINGEFYGVVHYIGHVDSLEFSEVYVGVELTEAVGDSDGSIGSKRYFSVSNNYGIFVLLSNILCVAR